MESKERMKSKGRPGRPFRQFLPCPYVSFARATEPLLGTEAQITGVTWKSLGSHRSCKKNKTSFSLGSVLRASDVAKEEKLEHKSSAKEKQLPSADN